MEEAAAVKDALEAVCDIIQYVNDVMHQRLIVSYNVRVQSCGLHLQS